MARTTLHLGIAVATLLALPGATPAADAKKPVTFARDIAPIFPVEDAGCIQPLDNIARRLHLPSPQFSKECRECGQS